MRRFDKRKNIMEANLRLEESYLNHNLRLKYNNLTEDEYNNILSIVKPTLNESTNLFELELNLSFYNEIKKGLINEGLGFLGTITKLMGNIKDFLTGFGIFKKLSEKLKSWLSKKFKGTNVEKNWGDFTGAIKWLYKALGPEGLTWIFAAVKYRTFKPTEDQKSTVRDDATKVWVTILKILLIFFVFKMVVLLGPSAIMFLKLLGPLGFKNALIVTGITAEKSILAAGLGAAVTKIFTIFSAYKKGEDIKKYSNKLEELEREEEEALARMEIKPIKEV